MGQKTGRPRGRPPKGTNNLQTAKLSGPPPGSKEAGLEARALLAAFLEKEMPLKARVQALGRIAKSENETPGAGNPASVLAVLRYMNELSGVVTVAQEKEAESVTSLPQIIIEGEPPPRPGSVEALKLLSTAKGSPYDEAFPSSPPAPPEPPKPFQSVVTVRES